MSSTLVRSCLPNFVMQTTTVMSQSKPTSKFWLTDYYIDKKIIGKYCSITPTVFLMIFLHQ